MKFKFLSDIIKCHQVFLCCLGVSVRFPLKAFSFPLSVVAEDTAFEAGVRVQIHSQAEPPFVHELGFGVAPGFQTFVATQEQRVGVPDFH